jgi:hypothetical protein
MKYFPYEKQMCKTSFPSSLNALFPGAFNSYLQFLSCPLFLSQDLSFSELLYHIFPFLLMQRCIVPPPPHLRKNNSQHHGGGEEVTKKEGIPQKMARKIIEKRKMVSEG